MKTIYYAEIKEKGYHEIPYASGSHYSGSSIEYVNYKIIKKMLKNYKYVYDCVGEFGTYAIAYDARKISNKCKETIREIKDMLEEYPALNDEKVYQYEMKIMKKFFDEEIKEELIACPKKEKKYWKEKLFAAMLDNMGTYAYIETGCIPYIAWKQLKKVVKYPY